MKITIEDPIWSKADKESVPLIVPCLAFKDARWMRAKHRRKKQTIKRNMVDRRNGLFLTGLIPHIKKYIRKKRYGITITGRPERLQVNMDYNIKGIKYRKDQDRILRSVARRQRGYIKSPTGSGKTVIAMGIFKMFDSYRRLFLCHTTDLLKQTYDEFIEKGFKKKQIVLLGAGNKITFKQLQRIDKKRGPIILIALIQSYSKLEGEELVDFWDVVVIDEAHHCTKRNSTYGKAMQMLLAVVRIGFTATPPPEQEKRLSLEGLLGPMIGELTVKEGIDLGILAKPKIKLIPVPYNSGIASNNKSYRDLYEAAIIKSRQRNKIIAEEIQEAVNRNESVLVMINNIQHGKEIRKILKALEIECRFVHGSTSREQRFRVARRLKEKKILCVICSIVWKEGINIKTLNNVINAAGGKDEKGVLQAMGRGLRTAKGKKYVILIDFLDPYKYLAEHTVARISIYLREGIMK